MSAIHLTLNHRQRTLGMFLSPKIAEIFDRQAAAEGLLDAREAQEPPTFLRLRDFPPYVVPQHVIM